MSAGVGRVVFKSSRHVTVLVNGVMWQCELRGNLRRRNSPVVVGDWVGVESVAPGVGRVLDVRPRGNWLSRRRNVGGGRELILAANLDQVLAVFAARRPELRFGTLDRVLVAAERQGFRALVVLNKIDLGVEPEVADRLAEYARWGYRVLHVSATTGAGLEDFRESLEAQVSLVSGPSGVGKSSLLKALFPERDIRIGDVSRRNDKGRHVTTAATWYPLAGDGAIVDTPGFREYALWDLPPGGLAPLMPDVGSWAEGCRFGDCLHRAEPKCAVREAVEDGRIRPERYRSYLGILAALEADELS